MSNNFYGTDVNLGLPFVFDKVYSNFRDAINSIDIDKIFLGRYILINYDLDPVLAEDSIIRDSEEWAAIADKKNSAKNQLIDQYVIADEPLDFDQSKNYHLSIWRKTFKNDKFYYEQIGSLDVTFPTLILAPDYKDPEEIKEEISIGKDNYKEMEQVKGSDNKTYYLKIPTSKGWDIQLGDVDFYKEGFNKNSNEYNEGYSDLTSEDSPNKVLLTVDYEYSLADPQPSNQEDLEKIDYFILNEGNEYEKAKTYEENVSYYIISNKGIKYLNINLPVIGNTIAEILNLMYGTNRTEVDSFWEFTYVPVAGVLSQEDIDKGIYFVKDDETEEYFKAQSFNEDILYYQKYCLDPSIDLNSVGGCIAAVHELLGLDHFYRIREEEIDSFTVTFNNKKFIDEDKLKEKVEASKNNYILFDYPEKVSQIASYELAEPQPTADTRFNEIAYFTRELDEETNEYIYTRAEEYDEAFAESYYAIKDTIKGTFCYSTANESTLIFGDFTMSEDGGISFSTFADLILKGHQVLNESIIISTKLTDYGNRLKILEDDYDNYKDSLERSFEIYSGLQVKKNEANQKLTGAEIFNNTWISADDIEGDGVVANYLDSPNRATENYASAHGKYTIASGEAQMTIGEYNKENPDAYFIIGNGTGPADSERNNLLEVYKNKQVKLDGTFNATESINAVKNIVAQENLTGKKIIAESSITSPYVDTIDMTLTNLTLRNNTINLKPAINADQAYLLPSGKIQLGNSSKRFTNGFFTNLNLSGESTFNNTVFISAKADVGSSNKEINVSGNGYTKSGQLVLGSTAKNGRRMCLDENEIAVFETDGNRRNLWLHILDLIPSHTMKGQVTSSLGTKERRWNIVYTVKGVNQSSDIRCKNIENSSETFDKLLNFYDNLNPIAFRWKNDFNDDKTLHIGLSAQEVDSQIKLNNLEKLDLGIISVDTEGYFSLKYDELHGLHMLKNQEQDKKIKDLEEKIKMLEEKINKLL